MTRPAGDGDEPRFICDAMCGGLARWLRALGYDARYTRDIADAALVQAARREGRCILSGDTRLFERRRLVSGEIAGLLIPHGLPLLKQVEFVVRRLRLRCGVARCMACNGVLENVSREAAGDRVPARSLLWATEFFECGGCRRVFWNGTHWRRIDAVRRQAEAWRASAETSPG